MLFYRKNTAFGMGKVLSLLILSVSAGLGMFAGETAVLSGKVTDKEGNGLPGLEVRVGEKGPFAITDLKGRYRVPGLQPGNYTVTVRWLGKAVGSKEVVIDRGGESVQDLKVNRIPSVHQDLLVTTTRTDSIALANLSETRMQRIRANVTGELLREITGVDAVRRGPIGLDPVVRGLRETEVGIYVDGGRIFPGGPGRMDSGLSHLDPSAVNLLQVVKGPYALTWGAGNLSAVRAETMNPALLASGNIGGSLTTAYHDNIEAAHLSAETHGRRDRFSWFVHGVTRESGDYEDGDGNLVPGDMKTSELRTRFAFETGPRGLLTLSAARQEQDDMDYPGRLLDAEYFDVDQYALTWEYTGEGLVRAFQARVYDNRVDHGMNNDLKPTGQPNPNRMPPFAMDVNVETSSDTLGGRFAFDLAPSADLQMEVGADFYRADRNALRTIARRDTGMVMFVDSMWPEARIDDLGLFVQVETPIAQDLVFSGALRFDSVDASTGEVSDFFRENAGTDTADSESNLSGSVTLSRRLNDRWTLTGGLGSVVRTADATERYSDRIPSAKAQMSAEFMGNPDLEPERSNQADLWLEGAFSRFSVNLSLFAREIQDYITIEATDLPKRLPLSPDTVFRYINGDASFHGAELTLSGRSGRNWWYDVSGSYLYGEDDELNEPVIGIAPTRFDVGLRYAPGDGRHSAGLSVTDVGSQDRVAVSRGETPTDGYTTVNLLYHLNLASKFFLRLGAANVTDEAYVNHLNAKNPFTGMQIAEPGRVFHCDLQYRF
ncbi:MAG: TonB-dependent receptor [Acidobacteriota bacterium]|nr:TonB-dependent receptor [Acidobacteriota bacterium]